MCRHHDTKRLVGGVFIRCRNPVAAGMVIGALEGRRVWKRTMSAQKSDYGVILSNPSNVDKMPIGTTRPASQLIGDGFHREIDDLDSGKLRRRNLNGCTWCHAINHSVSHCTLLTERLESIPDGRYQCTKCFAINHHRSSECKRPVDYGCSCGQQG